MTAKIKKTALMCAADLLSRQDQSESRLRQKLEMRNYSQTEIDNAISTLKQRNYLDDKSACANQFDIWYQSKRYSVRQICYKLVNLGFDYQLVESLMPKDFDEHDKAVAINMMRTKFKTLPEDNKIFQYLANKGFESSVVIEAVNEFKHDFID